VPKDSEEPITEKSPRTMKPTPQTTASNHRRRAGAAYSSAELMASADDDASGRFASIDDLSYSVGRV
jgi:hypothetical protein